MGTLGCDIYLTVKFLSFDGSEVTKRGQILIEKAKQLPVKIHSMFIEGASVPCGGYIEISLTAKRFTSRQILDEYKKIPSGKWHSFLGSVFNNGQKAIQHIPVVGKPLEKILPDAWQSVKLSCELSVTEDKKLSYWMGLIRRRDDITLLVFKGEFLVE